MCAKLDVKNILMIDGGFDQYETAQGSGIKVTVTCKDGFLINQSLQKSIYAECDNGEWKPFTPACFPGCTSLIATNGNVEGDVDGMPMQSANTELRLTCNDNYTVNELGIRVINVTCINGSWSPFIPRCELGCFGLDVENSIRNYTDVVSGAFVDIFCIENFTINGGDELKATISCENGVWKPQLPRCLPKCPPVEVRQGNISGGINIQTNLQLAETEVNITCINGYTINGTLNDTTFIKCSNGWWFPGIPWCEHSCSAPFVENGAIFGTLGSLEDSQPSRTVLLIKCWNGYSINGTRENETSVLCINGTWTPALPYCSKMCRSLSIAQANFVGGFSPMTNYQPSLTLIVVTCWSSESFYMLCEEGNWNQSIPICNGENL